ncbi:Protein arginine N-methyltransferase 1 [Rhynchospora pubera]|uniref:Protein arginine N-methyltransferase 1 n=1 Tax=Rhynchospora pubera TaxID=906938 RepID=A0AAV8HL63_9POAL|nr:Protein arginine N-methyltransferase 1 [Rhynchospora pubera]
MASEAIDPKITVDRESEGEEEEEEEEEEVEESWDDWRAGEGEDDEWAPVASVVCLFCTEQFDSSELLFDHCRLEHCFDFYGVVKNSGLDFYGSLKLVNYIRSQVSQNKCWSCDQAFKCDQDMLNHLHVTNTCFKKDTKFPWDNDFYLKPYLEDDSLLHSLSMDDEDDENGNGDVADVKLVDRKEFINQVNVPNLEKLEDQFGKFMENGVSEEKGEENNLKVVRHGAAARERKEVDEDYFGSYSSFGIHREMLGDKVRMDAYRNALLNNRSLLNGAVVLDVGCGTGILSLFAAQAGASKVVSVEASKKMATVATQIAKDNGAEVITVVHSMVEDIEKKMQIEPKSFDILVSEWMGYCLLYESMLSSVLYARDHYLKPGGAILPDTATIFGAEFGKGGTSMPFWEDVYGFNMSSVGKELVQDAARIPIVDTIDPLDIITDSVVLHSFDLVTMQQDDMDFTSTIELHLKPSQMMDHLNWCHGLVLWFDTDFTARFCKENPTILSTSPFGPKTHWAQTILTLREPIAMCSENGRSVISTLSSKEIGTEKCPVATVRIRVSIARASHRSIVVSLEATGLGFDGKKKNWPVQIFNL